MKKVVMKVELHEDKVKQKAMKVVSGLDGVDSISMDMKDKKLTVTGDIDPITIVAKLRKLCHTDILTVGPAKEPEKKKEDGKKEDAKKDEKKKDDGKKKDEPAKAVPFPGYFVPPPQVYPAYYQQQPQLPLQYYHNHMSVEEDPNSCVIC